MNERNSEMKMVWAVIAIVGAQLLGVDIGKILSLLTEAQNQLALIQDNKSSGLFGGDITVPALVGIYAWGRTKLKYLRESSPGTVDEGRQIDEQAS